MSKPKKLTKDAILNAVDRNVIEVEVPEWGGVVGIRVMNGVERDHYESTVRKTLKTNEDSMEGLRALLLSLTLCDSDTGESLFTIADASALNEKNGKVVDWLFEKANEINGLSKRESAELAKN